MQRQFELNFINENRWHYIVDGLQVTLELTLGAVILGVLIGFLVAVIRTTHDNADRPNLLVKVLNFFCRVYLTVIRGTPVVVQLMIIYWALIIGRPCVLLLRRRLSKMFCRPWPMRPLCC